MSGLNLALRETFVLLHHIGISLMSTEVANGAMIRSVPLVDRFAIGLSALCVVHCLLMPVLVVVSPHLAKSLIGSEALHLWLVYAVIPSSLFALTMGCTQHRRGLLILIGGIGLSFLGLGIAIESTGLSHVWEQIFTVSGAILIAFAHVRNFKHCRQLADCGCQHEKSQSGI